MMSNCTALVFVCLFARTASKTPQASQRADAARKLCLFRSRMRKTVIRRRSHEANAGDGLPTRP